MTIRPDDFKQLPVDGARFEALVCQLLEALGYRILEKPSVGTDGGRDILVECSLKDAMSERIERVVVQCKHYAQSGGSVRDADLGNWMNAMIRAHARGYLLVTDTRVTTNIREAFKRFTEGEQNTSGRWAQFWDVDDLIRRLNEQSSVREVFFPRKRVALDDLADEIRGWLEAIRYEVTAPVPNGDRYIDMTATLNQGTVKQRILVRCVGGEISASDVDAMDECLDRRTPQGWLVSDKRVGMSARTRAASIEGCQVFNLAELLQQKVWGNYFNALNALVTQDQIDVRYVDIGCHRVEGEGENPAAPRENYPSLEKYIDDWLSERSKMHLSVLGEFGAGKTWFCRHYAHRQLQRYLQDPSRERMPLLITLRTFAKAMTAQQLINHALMVQYKLPFIGDAFEVFRKMNGRGKILLILDGFDEMARQVDYETVVGNFWALAELVEEGSKVILTSRTEYFRLAKESERVLAGQELGRHMLVLTPPKFEVVYLNPLTDAQIREIIVRRLGADGSSVAQRVLTHSNLAGLARKPIVLELLLAALDEVSPDVLGNEAEVYLYATNRLLLRNITTERTFTSTSDKLYFLCELAWEMLSGESLSIHYRLIPDRIQKHFQGQLKEPHELDNWDYDLRSQTLLHRNAAGYYEFAHKSLVEYFVALKLASELGVLEPRFLATYAAHDGKPLQLTREPVGIERLSQSLGRFSLRDSRMSGVADLLPQMCARNLALLWEQYDEARRLGITQVAANLVCLLRWMGASLAGRNLRGIELAGERTFYVGDIRGADLRDAQLHEVFVDLGDMRGANLEGAEFHHARGNPIWNDFSDVGGLTFLDRKGTLAVMGFRRLYLWNIFDSSSDRDFELPRWFRLFMPPLASLDTGTLFAIHDFNPVFWKPGEPLQRMGRLPGSHLSAYMLSMSSSGQELVYCSPALLGPKKPGVMVWNVSSRQVVLQLGWPPGMGLEGDFENQGDRVVAFDVNGNLWSLEFKTRSFQKVMASSRSEYLKRPRARFTLSPGQGRLAIHVHPKIYVLDVASGQLLKELKSLSGHYFHDAQFSPDERYLGAVTGDNIIEVFSTADWSRVYSSPAHFEQFEFSPDGALLAMGPQFNGDRVLVVDLDSGRVVFERSLKLDFSGTYVRGLKAPLPNLKALYERGAQGRYTRAEVEGMSDRELDILMRWLLPEPEASSREQKINLIVSELSLS
ncbi:hypothetical protein HPC49_13210 [Pyxidicoccus fallax]|uniref:NACHT domain-containing protein n=1 Tax=Pyxidicoccus fallax TaxID=394095 RepID=A0A848LLP8_9BACT|nr:restriction endonuclease [Pyxidicoccus fallax]NMO18735.1 hypothetical protein [Pyxidicoccus fallax]NPC79192.1 hypothetical protein [Pyxidicoccus fallax]